MILLMAVGLAAVDIITITSLHSYLYGRVDDQLDSAHDVIEQYIVHVTAHGMPIRTEQIRSRVSPEVYVEILSLSGTLVTSRPSGSRLSSDPAPSLPRPLPVRATGAGKPQLRGNGVYRPDAGAVDVSSVLRHGPEYRLQAFALPTGTLVVATRLDSVDATLQSLEEIELAVSVGMVLALFVLMTVVIRRGLRPLELMAEEADTIAGGDLSRRVVPSDPETEIGRLGRALNRMLSQIETAFAQRTKSEDRLRRFLADASHELRTPLTSIRGYAELLRKGAIDGEPDRQRALGRIESEAARMGTLVEDLLTLARLGEEPELGQRRVDMVSVVAEAVADARAVDDTRSVTLDAPEATYVAGDEQRLGQLIHNLLGNALIHTAKGTPVAVRITVHDATVLLSVEDRGPGLDSEQAARVFDRFYRGDSTLSVGGSGLGLFIVAAVAQGLGGHVTVDTAVGRGSTFEVTLPLYGHGPVSRSGSGPVSGPMSGPMSGPVEK